MMNAVLNYLPVEFYTIEADDKISDKGIYPFILFILFILYLLSTTAGY